MSASLTSPPTEATTSLVEDLTPRQIVAELDRHVIGQKAAKRAVAIAMRNRWRRQQLEPEIAEEILPKNILMIGPTGVGKTEIARRLAKLTRAPFLKIEASKFTEVGYVGRDVESMIRDLMEISIALVRAERREQVQEAARVAARERLLDLLLPVPQRSERAGAGGGEDQPAQNSGGSLFETREKLAARLEAGALDHRTVQIQVEERSQPAFEMITPQGIEEIGFNLRDLMPGMFQKQQQREVKVPEALEILQHQEAEKLIDRQQVADEARHRVEQTGILFLDEIDKVCGRDGQQGPDVSREGVQRDLLPIVEGSTVSTKHGPVRTDHILFIGAGAFHVAKPSDMIPELQGRFPIRVELRALTEDDFVRILTEPRSALTRQYRQLLETEGVQLSFTDEAIREIARLAVTVNAQTENIGARRLATLLERLLEEVSFEAPSMQGVDVEVDTAYVRRTLADIVEDRDLSRYVL
ncbi:MAG: ATP-dependent protease ATPase subunit HslU [Acidobacteria bacterium]|nr:MAG: ATP-dependent protease ATPase subunit HslU [Acidobacteriota bacterium]REK12145.1 MAG: ATP-dependent protease ATPase subunit HslU [Acidobacteriota bacterium]